MSLKRDVQSLQTHPRYVEIDLVRGTALLMMLVSNFVTDLQFFLGFNQHEWFWRAFAYTTAGLFVAVSGVSMWVAHFKTKYYRRYLFRFAKLFGLGMLITLVTYLLLSEGTIYFGVLHFLGVASILVIPFYRLGWKNLLLVPVFFAGKLLLENVHSDNLLLLPLGITPVPFFTLDYFPVFPWFGVFLLGLGVGALVYPEGRRRMNLQLNSRIAHAVAGIGRHTLEIYLLHQPLFVGILLLATGGLPNLRLPW